MNNNFEELKKGMAQSVTRRGALNRLGGRLAGMALVIGLSINDKANGASFFATTPMHDPRESHSATMLPGGKVLVAGGWSGAFLLRSAEVYDPATAVWTTTGPLSTNRAYHTATLLPNGKVLVTGGTDSIDALSTAELYDPASGGWTAVRPMSTQRSGHTATLLPGGKVLVAGGGGASAKLYDPAAGTWIATGPMTTPHTFHTATLLLNGKVLVVGSFDDPGSYTPEVYDPGTGTWTATGAPGAPRDDHAATLLPNGLVLVTGGYFIRFFGQSLRDAELYDPVAGTWTNTTPMLTGRLGHTATFLTNGQVLVTGGEYYTFGSPSTLSDGELYDPAARTWTAAGNLSATREYHTANLLATGQVLISGGYDDDSDMDRDSADLYGAWPVVTLLTQPKKLADGSFQFTFTNAPGALWSGIATTNLKLASSNWTILGGATEISPGQFQFTDNQATNYPRRFYRVRSP